MGPIELLFITIQLLVATVGVVRGYAKEHEQVADVTVCAVAVKAVEATYREIVIWLEVGGAAVNLIGMLVAPRAGHVVLAIAER